MKEDVTYFIVETGALPEIFLKVAEAKKLLESGTAKTVKDATQMVNISRSAYYKYRDSVFPFYENFRGRTITIALTLENKAGVLSNALNLIAGGGANILTINQNIPINNIANVTITLETGKTDFNGLVNNIISSDGVNNLKIIARE
ncbi:MAG: ACT domain-containing protein [Clostridiales bacterium]|jgi:chorismate mutase|nr:ACT domain-containing protein [Clostridiales bacterium]